MKGFLALVLLLVLPASFAATLTFGGARMTLSSYNLTAPQEHRLGSLVAVTDVNVDAVNMLYNMTRGQATLDDGTTLLLEHAVITRVDVLGNTTLQEKITISYDSSSVGQAIVPASPGKKSFWTSVGDFFSGLFGKKETPKTDTKPVEKVPVKLPAKEPSINTSNKDVQKIVEAKKIVDIPKDYALFVVGDFFSSANTEKFEYNEDPVDPEISFSVIDSQRFDASTWKPMVITGTTEGTPLRRLEFSLHDDENDKYWDPVKKAWTPLSSIVRATPKVPAKTLSYSLDLPITEGSYELCALAVANDGSYSSQECVPFSYVK